MPKNQQAKSTDKTSPQGSKGDFIRKHRNLSVPEIVKRGAEAGFTIAPSFIYNIRSEEKRKETGGKPGKKTGKGTRKQVSRQASTSANHPRTAPPRESSSLEAELRGFVLRVGLDRAEETFGRVLGDLKRQAAGIVS